MKNKRMMKEYSRQESVSLAFLPKSKKRPAGQDRQLDLTGLHKKKNTSAERKKRRRFYIGIGIPVGLILVLTVCYVVFVYSSNPFIAHWRAIWIETAMTTGRHHWLAENFFPQEIIDEVMANLATDENVLGGGDSLSTGEVEKEPAKPPVETDILDQKNLVVGGKDYAGNTVLINDIEQGLVVSEIVGSGYRGKIMLVDDPSRVFLGSTAYKNQTGMRILDMMEQYGAIAGINASGFQDPGGEGNGGVVTGMSCSQGEYWGEFVTYYGSIVLTTDNKLVVGNISVWDTYTNIRDGIQFSPVLIANGEKQVSGSAGYGLQPRTAIGQRADGVIALLIVDGRDVSHSIGCTVGDMADILLSYDIINASSCDGGASSVLAYKGEVITKNCSANPSLGRILPNAFLVAPKENTNEK